MPPAPSKARRLHVLFKGRVQGVGFRFTAERVALETGVKGWVRNLPDGDVELVAEGLQPQLEKTLEGIEDSSIGKHIIKTIVRWEDSRNEFSDFRIEFVY